MIKGVQKNVIIVEPPKKSSFEKIFFIMKVKPPGYSSQDILTEANKIIGESVFNRSNKRAVYARRNTALAFAIGFAVGAALGALAALLML
ncbi:MAG: hypothetical protein IKL59_07680 [Clostridia bacterium]|nr:hypothetical protein [Clostridia bacterium]